MSKSNPNITNPSYKADLCMGHRYLYYVMNKPVIPDDRYDQLEREALETAPEDHPIHKPGSDMAFSYSQHHIQIAEKILRWA